MDKPNAQNRFIHLNYLVVDYNAIVQIDTFVVVSGDSLFIDNKIFKNKRNL